MVAGLVHRSLPRPPTLHMHDSGCLQAGGLPSVRFHPNHLRTGRSSGVCVGCTRQPLPTPLVKPGVDRLPVLTTALLRPMSVGSRLRQGELHAGDAVVESRPALAARVGASVTPFLVTRRARQEMEAPKRL
jgi:hypothetical protein